MPSYLLLSGSIMHYLESPALPLFPPICPCTQPQALPSPAALPRVTQPSAQHAHCASCAAFAPPFSLPFPCPFHYTRFGANSSLRTLRAHRKSRACLSMPPHEREGLTHPALKYFPHPAPLGTKHGAFLRMANRVKTENQQVLRFCNELVSLNELPNNSRH